MSRNSEIYFAYSFVSDSNCSYLALEYNNDIKLLNYQIEIISQNPVSAFIPFYVRREDDYIRIYYDITSKISLSQYLVRKRLDKNELLNLLKGITKNLMLHSNYLLDLSGFVINSDFIYINPATAEVSLIYIPISESRDSMKLYCDFLKDLIVDSASIDDNAKDNYVQRILSYLKQDTFSLNGLSKLITDLLNSGGLSDCLAKAADICEEKSINEEIADEKVTHHRSLKNTTIVKTIDKKYIFSIVLLQLLIVIAASIACLLLISHYKGDIISISGILLISVALDMLIIRRISGSHNKYSSANEMRKEVENKQLYLVQKSIDNSINTHKKVRESEQGIDNCSYKEIAPADNGLRAYDTILISDTPNERHPYLDSMGVYIGERVIINKDKFVIGRLGSMVDHVVQGSTIGKLHAEITGSEGNFYIRDLNSKNGTYINGVRITSNKECEIRNNDKISLSDHEYIFKQQANM